MYVGPRWLRQQWRPYLAAAVIIALTFGLALFALAGARRTQSSFPRLLRSVNASTVAVSSAGLFDEGTTARIAALPQVASSRTYVGLLISVAVDGRFDPVPLFEAEGTFDGRYFDQDRFTPTTGRMADPGREDEVVVNEFAAEHLGFRVGQSLDIGIFSLDQVQAPAGPPAEPRIRSRVTIVGIGLFPDEIVQDDADRTSVMLVTPALTRLAAGTVNYGLQGLVLRRGDTDLPDFLAALDRIVPLGEVEVIPGSVATTAALRAVEPLSSVIAVFGALAAVAGLLLAGQALARAVRAGRDDRRLLVVLGESDGEAVLSSLLAPTAAVLAGVTGACVVAVLLSPAMPLGPVRRVEAHPGFDADWAVLLLGGAVACALLMAWSVFAIWRDIRRSVPRWRRSALPKAPRVAAFPGIGPEAAVGLGFALSTQRGVPVARSAILSGASAAAAVVAALLFSSSLTQLLDTPETFGWDFDSALVDGNGYDNIDEERAAEILDADAAVAAWSGAYFGMDSSDGRDVPLIGMRPDSDVHPPLLAGRFISGDDEIVLGRSTANLLRVGVGDSVTMEGGPRPRRLRVVGIAVLPSIGKTHAQRTSLGRGGIVVPSAVPGVDLDMLGVHHDEPLGPNAILVRYVPTVDAAGETRRLRTVAASLGGFAGFDVLSTQRPAEIVVAEAVGSAPSYLALGLAAGAAFSLLVALGGSVRRRRAELAILTVLGFSARQRAACVVWQSAAVVVVALSIGVPSGVVLGRQLWSAFAGRLDVAAQSASPWLAGAAVCTVALSLAICVALAPARAARRIDVAGALRSERQ
jgi:hypothetical protein